MPASMGVDADTNSLDVARSQQPSAVTQLPRHYGPVPDQLAGIPDERVHATLGVSPGVVGHLDPEHIIKQRAWGDQRHYTQVCGLTELNLTLGRYVGAPLER
jgi:hypothetical protein